MFAVLIVSMTCGSVLLQLLMFLKIIAGFTTGAAVHVFTAQLNKILGVALPRRSGAGKLIFVSFT